MNISADDLGDARFDSRVAALLTRHQLPPSLLTLELTESGFIEDPARALQMLDALAALGVSLSIDDFGTGHSSLAYLKRFPIDTLKIDRSFVSDLTRSTEDKTITAAIITMGKSLDLIVVAEGVETVEQLDFLRAHGCDEFQGYYAHKPMPADDFARLLQIEKDRPAVPAR